ncbi:MAG: beta-N-acetylglucosaminidase domain-containing protein [Candidatus Eisenbacteria bacterium]
MLDKVFGAQPPGYLERLGRRLHDPAIGVFWTGEEGVLARDRRRPPRRSRSAWACAPVLWDNYPVNDGARMSQSLHLRVHRAAGGQRAAAARSTRRQPTWPACRR